MPKAIMLPALLCMSVTSSCVAPGGGLGFMMFDPNHHVPAAEPLFGNGEDACIDGSYLLSVLSRATASKGEPRACTVLRYRIQNALPFGNIYDGTQEHYNATQRNEAIDTLILASNKRCGDYVHFLQTYQGNVRVTSGLAAQATAILATLATGSAAQWLAAGSAFSTGAGNSLYEVHFANKTVAMLTKAFDTARAERLRDIEDKKQCPVSQYTFTKALADVYDYHTSCSLTTGLMEAQDAVEQQRSPNLETLRKLADEIDATREAFAKFGVPQLTDKPVTANGGTSGATTANGGGATGTGASGTAGTGSTNKIPEGTSGATGSGGGAMQSSTRVPACPFSAGGGQPDDKKASDPVKKT